MALLDCSDCGAKVSSNASKCATCGAPVKSAQNLTIAIVPLLAAGFFGWFYFGDGLDRQVATDMAKIHNQVADDAVAQYDIARRNGSPVDICVHAGIVSAAYLQAKDEAKYARWKQIENTSCEAADLP